jgi:hypothetical protein
MNVLVSKLWCVCNLWKPTVMPRLAVRCIPRNTQKVTQVNCTGHPTIAITIIPTIGSDTIYRLMTFLMNFLNALGVELELL